MDENNVNLVEILKGIPMFDQVLEILEKKEFIKPNSSSTPEDVAISEMSPLERAIYTRIARIQNDVENELNSISSPGKDKISLKCFECFGFMIGVCPVGAEIEAVDTKDKERKFLEDFMYGLITSRLIKTDALLLRGICIRDSFMIISHDVEAPKSISTFEFENASLEKMVQMSLKGTFMEKVSEILETNQFVDPESLLEENEEIIREMLPIERAIYSVWKFIHDNVMQIKESNGIEKIEFDEKNLSIVDSVVKELCVNKIQEGSIDDVLWSLIKVGIKGKYEKSDSIGIRSGFKVVGFEIPNGFEIMVFH